MVYQNKCVMCILHNGVPQKELKNGTVVLPFGTEYSVRFRNKHNRRVVVQFWIDGEPMHQDDSHGGYVVPANGYIDIERPFEVARKFKFVDLDSPEAIDHGKNGPNHDQTKGLVEARFYLERERSYSISTPYQDPYPYKPWVNPDPHWFGPISWSEGTVRGSVDSMNMSANMVSPASGSLLRGRGELKSKGHSLGEVEISYESTVGGQVKDGATVEGAYSSQRFSSVHIDVDWSNYVTLKLFIRGQAEEKQVTKITIDSNSGKSASDIGDLVTEVLKEAEAKKAKEASRLEKQILAAKQETLKLELELLETKRKKLEKELSDLKA